MISSNCIINRTKDNLTTMIHRNSRRHDDKQRKMSCIWKWIHQKMLIEIWERTEIKKNLPRLHSKFQSSHIVGRWNSK